MFLAGCQQSLEKFDVLRFWPVRSPHTIFVTSSYCAFIKMFSRWVWRYQGLADVCFILDTMIPRCYILNMILLSLQMWRLAPTSRHPSIQFLLVVVYLRSSMTVPARTRSPGARVSLFLSCLKNNSVTRYEMQDFIREKH